MDASELKRIKEQEAENAKLKRMFADLALENTARKDLFAKSSETARAAVKIGLMNLTYNMRLLEFLRRAQSACGTV